MSRFTFEVERISKYLYNLEVLTIERLQCYEGHNVLLQVRPDNNHGGNPQPSDWCFILKFQPSKESVRQMQKCQTDVMRFLQSKDFPCPEPVMSRNEKLIQKLPKEYNMQGCDKDHSVASLPDDEFLMVSLLRYIPGDMFSSLHPVPDHLFYEAGQTLATLHDIMKVFSGARIVAKDRSAVYFMLLLMSEIPHYMLEVFLRVRCSLFAKIKIRGSDPDLICIYAKALILITGSDLMKEIRSGSSNFDGDLQPLKDYSHQCLWSMEQVPQMVNFLWVLEDDWLKSLVPEIVKQFEEKVHPRLCELPKGVIHGDYNDDNIIISRKKRGSELQGEQSGPKSETIDVSICGIVDFGDASYSCLVFDVAIALSFMVITDVSDIMDASRFFLMGYTSKRKLLQPEKDVLSTCVIARLAQNIVLALNDYRSDSSNQYLLASMDDYPVALKKLWSCTETEIRTKWNL